MRACLIGLMFAIIVPNVYAVTITSADLPVEIQSCISAGTCSVDMSSYADIHGMSAFAETTSSGVSFLIRYNLVLPSKNTYFDGYTGQTTVTPYSGALWVNAPFGINPTETYHNFTIYIDKVSPVPWSYNNYPGSSTSFNVGMTTADMLAGGGFTHGSGDPYYTVQGSLQRSMFTCVECAWGTDFNLVYLDYSSSSFFNPDDQRTLVLSQYDNFFASYATPHSSLDQFYVQSVPIPSAFILFGSGLLGLLRFRRSSSRESR